MLKRTDTKLVINRPQEPKEPFLNLISFVKDRPAHDLRYSLDYSKITNELGWRPRHTLEEGLTKTVDWYLANQEWIEKLFIDNKSMDYLSI